tara:strand:- start:15078 stop:15533 length:456 start_codon:yes stop_codon:yes gene_type:complete
LLDSLFNIFQKDLNKEDSDELADLKLLSGIMIEAANSDGIISNDEIEKISNALVEIFKQDKSKVAKVIEEGISNKNEPRSLYFYTSKINKIYSEERKILLIEILWEIILSDGKIHDFESNLIRRLAGLLYISDVSCGNAKIKAIEKIKSKG